MNARPLFRITLGPVHEWGLAILKKNIKFLRKNYPEVDLVVCYNQIEADKLKDLDVIKIDQSQYYHSLNFEPQAEQWKIYPPRLRYEAHEIVFDNDILIFQRVPEIDEFLTSNKPLLFEGRVRVFGKYESKVPKGVFINSGIFGLPPYFDFKSKINDFCKDDIEKRWTTWGDDQGVIAGVLSQEPFILLKMNTVMNYLDVFDFMPLGSWRGIHLIGSNRGKCNKSVYKQLMIKLN